MVFMMRSKIRLFGFLIAIVLATAALPVNAQTAAGSAQTAAAQGPDISLFTLLNAAEGGHAVWRPDWPLDMPPDLFSAGSSALSIIADFGDEGRIEFSRDSGGRILSFPLLMNAQGEGKPGAAAAGTAANTGPGTATAGAAANAGPEAEPDSGQQSKVFFQGRCEYDREGRLSKLIWKDPLAQSDDSDAEALRWDGDGRPVLWRVFSGDYYFAALEYLADTLIETWYDRDGTGLFVVITESGKQTRIDSSQEERQETQVFYNSWGLISGIEDPSGNSVSALYNQQGMPRYLELTVVSVDGTADGGNASGNTAASGRLVYTYLWDAAGKLVRLSGGSPAVDCRYEYTLDSRGNWTERKEYSMKALGPEDWGRLVPYREKTVRRIVRYGEPPKADIDG